MERLGGPVQFAGRLRVPDDPEAGIRVVITVSPERVRVTEDGVALGTWPTDQVRVSKVANGNYSFLVAGDHTLFVPDDPVGFSYYGMDILDRRPRTATRTLSRLRALFQGPADVPKSTPPPVVAEPNEVIPDDVVIDLLSEPFLDAPAAETSGKDAAPLSPPVGAYELPAIRAASPSPTENPVERLQVGDMLPPFWASLASAPPPPANGPARVCAGRRKDGLPCGSRIVGRNGFCSAHDPNPRPRTRRANPALRPLLRRLNELIDGVEAGEVDPDMAQAVASLVRAVCALLDIEQRRRPPG